MVLEIINQVFLDELAPFATDTVTIQQKSITYDAAHQSIENWVNIANGESIKCFIGNVKSVEIQEANKTRSIMGRRIVLLGYYASIKVQMRAVAGSEIYNILAVYHDGYKSISELDVEQVII